MKAIVEVVRPYSEAVFEYLPGEGVVTVNGHAFWCATTRTRRVAGIVAENNIEDAVWVCIALNDVAIAAALTLPHRRQRLEIHQLEELLHRLVRQQSAIAENAELLALMDDPDELADKISQVRSRLNQVRGGV
jgi:hypothetical protein